MKQLGFSRWLTALLAVVLLGSAGCTRQAKAKRHLQRANSYFAANQYDRAEIEYLNVMRLQPTNIVAIHNLAEIYYSNESFQRAAAFLNAAKQLAPSDVESRGKLARLMISAGGAKQARAEVDAILQLSPINEDALLTLVDLGSQPQEIKTNLQRLAALQQKAGDRAIFHVARGLIALKQKDEKTGQSELKTAVALEPKSAVSEFFLGAFYAEKGSNALAEPHLKAAADLSPLRSQRKLRYAAFKAQTAGPTAAAPLVAEITSKAPDFAPAWLLSARLAAAQTNLAQCEVAIKHVLDRDPVNFDGLSMRSDLEIFQNKPDQAVKTMEKLCDAYPKSAIARYRLALACLKANNSTKASFALNQAVTQDPLLVPAVLQLSEINLRKGEVAAPIDSLPRLIKAYPNLERAYILLGTAYMRAGRYNDSITTLNQALQKFPANVEAPHLIAVDLKQQGRYAEARNMFEKLVRANPDDSFAIMQLVSLDVQAQNTDGAAKRIQAWMDKSPKDAAPVLEMAKLRYSLKDTKGAQSLLEKAIQMNNNLAPAYVMLGRIYMESNQIDSALEKTREGLAKNPNDVTGLLLAGSIYEAKHDYNNARDTYQKLLAVDPQNVIGLNNLSEIYAERFNDLEKAYPLGRKAQDIAGDNPLIAGSIADTYGWILSRRGEFGPALGLLKMAAQAQPAQPEIHAHLGITQYLSGDESAARASLENALKLSPSFERRDQAEKCLAILNINPADADAATVAMLEKHLQQNPADTIALARLSSVYEKKGDLAKTIALYDKAVAANPKSAIATARLAELTDQKQDFNKALELARNARKLDSNDPEVAHIAGRIATESSDLKDQQWGLTLLQESSQKTSADASVAYDLGWSYYVQGRIAEAQTALQNAVTAGGNTRTGITAKRLLDFIPLSDPARAAQQQPLIDQALKADPNYLPALAARAAMEQAKGDTAATLKTLDQILTRYPGFAPAVRSYVILSTGKSADSAKALALATRARELFPEDAQVAKALGILQYQQGDYSRAAMSLKSVAAKQPNDETVQYYLGMSHYQLKQPRESKVALKKAIELQPKAPFIAEAQRVLAELK